MRLDLRPYGLGAAKPATRNSFVPIDLRKRQPPLVAFDRQPVSQAAACMPYPLTHVRLRLRLYGTFAQSKSPRRYLLLFLVVLSRSPHLRRSFASRAILRLPLSVTQSLKSLTLQLFRATVLSKSRLATSGRFVNIGAFLPELIATVSSPRSFSVLVTLHCGTSFLLSVPFTHVRHFHTRRARALTSLVRDNLLLRYNSNVRGSSGSMLCFGLPLR
jgi:hypothetical protein